MQRTITPDVSRLLTYAYVNYDSRNSTATKTLALPQFWPNFVKMRRSDLDFKSQFLVAMDFFSLTYFLEQRTEPWFYRGICDSFLNLKRLPSFLSELTESFNPWTDSVVRGDCVVSRGILFLQGGSGFLCSRAAAQRMNNITQFLQLWVGYEDATMGPFLKSVGISIHDSCSGAFMGHGPDEVSDVDHAQRCPVRDLKRVPVPYHVERVRDLFAYHKQENSGHHLENALPWAEWLFQAPESLRWFITDDDFWPDTCTFNGTLTIIDRKARRLASELQRVMDTAYHRHQNLKLRQSHGIMMLSR
jgi:hypothetical protein